MWKNFKKTYSKKYADPDSEIYRMNIFFYNVELVQGVEALGITEFMDISPEEFA